jgi:lysophospholipid acyltransferase (LPLAT)-like uncharacterized protein
MRIRHPVLIKALGCAGAWLLRGWMSTLRYRQRCEVPDVDPLLPGRRGPFIYAFWHENLLLPAYCYRPGHTSVLISQHADGELIAEVCRHLRLHPVRGSSTRGGIEALRQLLRECRQGHVVITPDGPRGPRRQVQPGLVYLAARTGLSVVAVGIAYQKAWRLHSWDRFALPQPWSLGACVISTPIHVPADADRERLEEYRQLVQQAMLRASESAERLAGSSVVRRAPSVVPGVEPRTTDNGQRTTDGFCSCTPTR